MTVAFCSKEELKNIKPSADTVLISIRGRTDPPSVNRCGWKAHYHLEMDVLNPTGPEGSFKEMDEQAKEIAPWIIDWIEGAENVIVQCQYGEIRSVCIADAIAYIKRETLMKIKNGKFIKNENHHRSTFQGRTSMPIIRLARKTKKDE